MARIAFARVGFDGSRMLLANGKFSDNLGTSIAGSVGRIVEVRGYARL